MKLLFVFLLSGCMIHSTKVQPSIAGITFEPTIQQDIPGCFVQDEVYFWPGNDGMIGWGRTCAEAEKMWEKIIPLKPLWKI